jgi:hypothetical protein
VLRNQLCPPGRGNVVDGASGGHAEKKAGGSKKWKNESRGQIECVGGLPGGFRPVLGVDVEVMAFVKVGRGQVQSGR